MSTEDLGHPPRVAAASHRELDGVEQPAPEDAAGVDDLRAGDPVDRLLEDSWTARDQRASRREMLVEGGAALLFLAAAVPLGLPSLLSLHFSIGLTVLLLGLYALVAGAVRFPIGAGNVVPTYLLLAPMLLLAPPQIVPLLVAAGLLLAAIGRRLLARGGAEQLLFAIPNGWHSLAPTVVLLVCGTHHPPLPSALIAVAAFTAACGLDLLVSTVRESAALSVAPSLQFHVIAKVWLVDACVAPAGVLLALAARREAAVLIIVVPITALLALMERDRKARIDQAQHRLELVGRERARLQAAVGRLGDALAATLDLESLTRIALQGCVEALDADAGLLTFEGIGRSFEQTAGSHDASEALSGLAAHAAGDGVTLEARDGQQHLLAIPFSVSLRNERRPDARGALAVARSGREFRADERGLMHGLVTRTEKAVSEIFVHETLRAQAVTDPLTQLPNRRQLASDLSREIKLAGEQAGQPLVLMLFDLDGFKIYNDTFGHLAGDALLARLGQKLAASVAGIGTAYRLGGDEFCALVRVRVPELRPALARLVSALRASGQDFAVEASCGAVLVPQEAATPDGALLLADERMYAHKQRSRTGTREQTRNVLLTIMHARQPGLPDHSSGVASLAIAVGRRLGMDAEGIDELRRAAELHDIGKVGIPDAILEKPGPLSLEEWEYMRQHTILGERILSAAPALRPVAQIVRASHERWDGQGYPDRLRGQEIPLAARVIAACDAYDAITSDRCYRSARPDEAAREELIREAGRQFDPGVVAALLEELADQHQLPIRPEPSADLISEQYAREEAERLLGLLLG